MENNPYMPAPEGWESSAKSYDSSAPAYREHDSGPGPWCGRCGRFATIEVAGGKAEGDYCSERCLSRTVAHLPDDDDKAVRDAVRRMEEARQELHEERKRGEERETYIDKLAAHVERIGTAYREMLAEVPGWETGRVNPIPAGQQFRTKVESVARLTKQLPARDRRF